MYSNLKIWSGLLIMLIILSGCGGKDVDEEGYKKFRGTVGKLLSNLSSTAYAAEEGICRSRKSSGATDYVNVYLLYASGTEVPICSADIISGNYDLEIREELIPEDAMLRIKATHQGESRGQVISKANLSTVENFDINRVTTINSAVASAAFVKRKTVPNMAEFVDSYRIFEEAIGANIASISGTWLAKIESLAALPEVLDSIVENITRINTATIVTSGLVAQVQNVLANSSTELYSGSVRIPPSYASQVYVGDINSLNNGGFAIADTGTYPVFVDKGIMVGKCFYIKGSFDRVRVANTAGAVESRLAPLYNAFMGYAVETSAINNYSKVRETIVKLSPYDDFSVVNTTNALQTNSGLSTNSNKWNFSKNIAKLCVNANEVVSFNSEFTDNLKGGIENMIVNMELSPNSPKQLILELASGSPGEITINRMRAYPNFAVSFNDLFAGFLTESGTTGIRQNAKSIYGGNKIKVNLDGSGP